MNDSVNKIEVAKAVLEAKADLTGVNNLASLIDMDSVLDINDPTFNSMADCFIEFYEDAVKNGIAKNMVVKMMIKIQEFLIKKSITENLDKIPDAPASVIIPKDKSSKDFKAYLMYAAEKYGTAEEKMVVSKLVARIK